MLTACLNSLPKKHDWKIYIALESGGGKEVSKVASDWQRFFPFVEVWRNERRLGCSLNIFTLWSIAFSDGADAILHLEDDIILSPDAIDLCDWYLSNLLQCQGGLALCRKDHEGNNPSAPSSISLTDTWMGLLGQGYCFTRQQWFDFVLRNFWAYDPSWGHDIWDYTLAMMAQKLGKLFARPRLSRSRHNGSKGFHGVADVFPEGLSDGTHRDYHVE